MRRIAPLSLTVLILAACGSPERPASVGGRGDGKGPKPWAAEQRYGATGMVLEEKGAGPRLCLGAVLDSLPPLCGGIGIPIASWDWDAVSGEESSSGTTWGTFEVTGLYDGEIFSLIEAGPPRRQATEDEPIESACPDPAGSSERPYPDLSSEADYRPAIKAARREPAFAGAWIDYIDEPTEFTDPQDVILNLAFTGDLERHERHTRHSWDGPLCVVKHERSLRRLRRIRRELHGPVAQELGLEILFSDASEYRNVVELGVVVIDAASRKEIDERYGEGVVEVTAQLQPIP
jgi:hypothetical protein